MAESVEGSSLSLEGIDNVHGSDGLPLSVLSVGHSVSDDSLEESLEGDSGVVVDVEADSLDSASSGESSDGGLGDSLERASLSALGVPLGSDLS